MKLVIYTQVRENYAAHNGVIDPTQARWKNKGGDIYVVENIDPSIVLQSSEEDLEELKSIFDYVTEDNNSFQEYVISWEVMADDEEVGEPWETPYIIEAGYLGSQGAHFRRVTDNTTEYGWLHRLITQKEETWIQMKNGDRRDYRATWTMKGGVRITTEKMLQEYIDLNGGL